MEVTAFMFNQNLSSIFQLVKPFTRKLASDNLVSPIFSPFTALQLKSRKQDHQLHYNESMGNDETKMLEKTCFQVDPCQRNVEKRNNVVVGKVYLRKMPWSWTGWYLVATMVMVDS